MVGWNISRNVVDMPLAIAAMFFRIAMVPSTSIPEAGQWRRQPTYAADSLASAGILFVYRFFGARVASRRLLASFFRFFPVLWRSPFLFIFLWKILHDERNAPVGRIKRVLRIAQPTIGISAHLRNLIRRQSVLLRERVALERSVESSQFP